jgi:hypothetical protein
MGTCIYCGDAAGLFRRQHKTCRERHDNAAKRIPEFFAEALTSSILPLRFRELTEKLAKDSYISDTERRQLILDGLAALIDTALEDKVLTSGEEDRIDELLKTFDLKLTDLDASGAAQRLAKSSILRQLNEGKLPTSLPHIVGNNPINLERGEVILWVFKGATYFTPRTRTQYVGVSHGISFRVMKGIYYRVGAFKGAPVQTPYLSNEGTGDFVITNRNVYFLSPLKTLKLPVRKIVAIEPYSDGLSISRDGTSAKPAIFTLDDPWFAANAISRLNQLES